MLGLPFSALSAAQAILDGLAADAADRRAAEESIADAPPGAPDTDRPTPAQIATELHDAEAWRR